MDEAARVVLVDNACWLARKDPNLFGGTLLGFSTFSFVVVVAVGGSNNH